MPFGSLLLGICRVWGFGLGLGFRILGFRTQGKVPCPCFIMDSKISAAEDSVLLVFSAWDSTEAPCLPRKSHQLNSLNPKV